MPPFARVVLYAATVGAFALVGHWAVHGALPLAVALPALIAYVALVGCGVAYPRLAMFVDVLCRGPAGARGVALTFDDGPHPEHTPCVLELLERAGFKATFFLIGRKAAAHPELVRAIAAAGHLIGVHGHAHDRLLPLRRPSAVADDIAAAIAIIEAITGQRPTLFRPPVGLTSPRIERALRQFDLNVVGFSVRALDGWRGASPKRVVARVVPRLRDGAIVLLHDAAERDDFLPACIAALPPILEAMRIKNLTGVRLDAWAAPIKGC